MQKTTTAVLPGSANPLGAHWDGKGTNFALYSEGAEAVELCLFDQKGRERKMRLFERDQYIWHGYIPDVGPGQLYGYRVHGPFEPEQGLRFNPAKLVIDPYARALKGKVDWDAPVFGYKLGEDDLSKNDEDSAWGMPKGIVVDPAFTWEGDERPRWSWHRTIIYEAHVKGMTMRHPKVPENLRGTYKGLATEPVLDHLGRLGVTAIELLPIHSFLDDKHLIDRGLINYWGYNTTNFFAPDARYSSVGDSGGQVNEFREMVKAFHRSGIEVILDVVYNHTSEGSRLGPTLSYRGIDNASYYRLVEDDPRYYFDYTGTGNTLNSRNPNVLRLIMDSLRYWVTEMHVDGFRFDLAATLAREMHDVDRLSAFFDIIQQDPVLSAVKLIAEPWDLGDGGYQVGNFPPGWTEWNGKYRDGVRRFWRGDDYQLSDMAYRITGSSDLYEADGRRPNASINFITAHDGFTLNDLVSYNEKHNSANGEDNNDGTEDNISWNCGEEGETDKPEVNELRERQKRNFLATLILSQGVPMLTGGDEMGRTQGGNNNAYCQDNEITWLDWDLSEADPKLLEFTQALVKTRGEHPILRRRRFFQGRRIRGAEVEDITWLRPDGSEMNDEDWDAPWVRSVAVRFGGDSLAEWDSSGNRVRDDTLLLLMNASEEEVDFTMPDRPASSKWTVLIDTAEPGNAHTLSTGDSLTLVGRSLKLLSTPA